MSKYAVVVFFIDLNHFLLLVFFLFIINLILNFITFLMTTDRIVFFFCNLLQLVSLHALHGNQGEAPPIRQLQDVCPACQRLCLSCTTRMLNVCRLTLRIRRAVQLFTSRGDFVVVTNCCHCCSVHDDQDLKHIEKHITRNSCTASQSYM